jgi:hypothetical protein
MDQNESPELPGPYVPNPAQKLDPGQFPPVVVYEQSGIRQWFVGFLTGTLLAVVLTAGFFGITAEEPVLPPSLSQILVNNAPCRLQYMNGTLKHEELGQLKTAQDLAVQSGMKNVTFAHEPMPTGGGEYIAISGFICPEVP